MTARVEERVLTNVSDYDHSNFYYSSGDDIFAILDPYNQWYTAARREGYYLYAQPMTTPAVAAMTRRRAATSSARRWKSRSVRSR